MSASSCDGHFFFWNNLWGFLISGQQIQCKKPKQGMEGKWGNKIEMMRLHAFFSSFSLCMCVYSVSLTDIALGWIADRGRSGKRRRRTWGKRRRQGWCRERRTGRKRIKESDRECVFVCVLSIAGSGHGRRKNSRLTGEDSMAASGPSQAKHTAKESSSEEKRVGETRGRWGRIEDISKDRKGGEIAGG